MFIFDSIRKFKEYTINILNISNNKMLYMVKKMLQNVDNIILNYQEFLDCLLDSKNNLHIEILDLSRASSY